MLRSGIRIMVLLEYEAKNLLEQYGLPLPARYVVRHAGKAPDLPMPLVLKAQIPKGGRGKAGGVLRADDETQYRRICGQLLGSMLLDCPVNALLAEEALYPERELYISLLIDRSSQRLTLVAIRDGGVEVEQVATGGAGLGQPPFTMPCSNTPDKASIASLATYYGLPTSAHGSLGAIVSGLYKASRQEDAILVEINPLMLLADGRLVCADAKIELDDAAAFRHPGRVYEQNAGSSQFVVLNEQGTIASMANGAGLAMATVDAIEAAGAKAANFYDVGGGTNTAGMVRALGQIGAMPEVKAIVVNIFGGITRCDEVAQAIIEAQGSLEALPALYVRLTGTNEAEGRRLLDAAGIPILPTLADCVAAAVEDIRSVQ